jgi:hypothetical protein
MADDTEPSATPADPAGERESRGVRIPVWLAAALIVVVALAIGGTGYAIGNSGGGSSGDNTGDPIANVRRPDGDQSPGTPARGPRGRDLRGEQGPNQRGRCNAPDQSGNGSGNGSDNSESNTPNQPHEPLGPVGPDNTPGNNAPGA